MLFQMLSCCEQYSHVKLVMIFVEFYVVRTEKYAITDILKSKTTFCSSL